VHLRRLSSVTLVSALLGLLACETATPSTPDAALGADATHADATHADTPHADASGLDAPRADDAFVPTTDAPGDDPPPPDPRVGVFVAQGYAGRVSVSCDDGRTWSFDREDALADESGLPLPPVDRCFDGVDCDHHPGRAKGIVFPHGWFVRTNGWGPPGAVRRSRNGITWEKVLEGTTFGGIATSSDGASEGFVLLGARTPRRSADDAASFVESENEAIPGWNVRRAGHALGRFVIVGGNGTEVGVSADGVRWAAPTSIDARCGEGIQNDGGIAEIGDAMVIVGGNGTVCRSTDGGVSWTAHALPDGATPSSSDVIRAGSELFVWADGALLRSSDGVAWTSTPTEPRITVGAVARSPSGTFVAVRGGWGAWNEAQRFYRSPDGVRWEELSTDAARRAHPIGWIAWGEVDGTLACRE
jgi:hypothetical protein